MRVTKDEGILHVSLFHEDRLPVPENHQFDGESLSIKYVQHRRIPYGLSKSTLHHIHLVSPKVHWHSFDIPSMSVPSSTCVPLKLKTRVALRWYQMGRDRKSIKG